VSMRWQWRESLTRPIRAFQRNYVPVVVVYFAYGTLGLIDVTRDLWIKESLSFTPSQLAGISVWFTLPWTVKMVFGELVDTVPIFGSQLQRGCAVGARGRMTLFLLDRTRAVATSHPMTMSPLVLCTMANSSLPSASGTLNLAMVSSKSLQKAAHSLSVILRCS